METDLESSKGQAIYSFVHTYFNFSKLRSGSLASEFGRCSFCSLKLLSCVSSLLSFDFKDQVVSDGIRRRGNVVRRFI